MRSVTEMKDAPYTLEEEVEKAAKLASVWPKIHKCSEGFVVSISQEQWALMEVAGHMDDEFASHEMRNCRVCGSTLVVPTVIHDLEKE